MDYFKILNLNREPFSNSPDPDHFFFQSRRHVDCLQKAELAVRLCRGLNVVIGDVGTGKTTLCRRLIRNFSKEADIETHLVLDPSFSSHTEFLTTVAESFGIEGGSDLSIWELKEEIKKYLFKRAIDEEKIIVLIIDEGQKLSELCLEILREFLNYETNEKKLLQIVIFAQKEFQKTIEAHENFADRINLYHILAPLNFRDTRAMIEFRLEVASSGDKSSVHFSLPALWAIYRASRGYPRKIINICHRAILTIIIQNRAGVGLSVARFCIRKTLPGRRKMRLRMGTAVATAAGVLLLIYVSIYNHLPHSWQIGMSAVSNSASGDEKAEEGITGKSYLKSVREGSMHLREEIGSAGIEDISSQKSPSNSLMPGAEEVKKSPDSLGQIVVLQNDTLGNMIFKVYGIINERYLRLVSEYNKDIKDPNHIESGRMIKFPAIRAEVRRLPHNYWWVKLAEESSLEEAYRFLKTHSESEFKLAMVPNWNRGDGLNFTVLCKRSFMDEKSARNFLSTLPSDLTEEAGLKDSWAEDTIFFASPVF